MVINKLVRRADITSSFISNEPGLMSLFVQPVQRFSLLLAAPEAVTLGALPLFVILAGQYCHRSLAFNSSLSFVIIRNRPSSSVSIFTNSMALSLISSMHLSTAKSTSIDGYNAFTSVLPTMLFVKSSDSLHSFILLSRSSVLSQVSSACLTRRLRIMDKR